MAHLYLPRLTDENIGVPKETGVWSNNEKKIILGISDGILVDEQAMNRGVSSIPDIWARPLLFRSALKPGSGHPLKNRIYQEWKGLLSLLALYKIRPNLSSLFEINEVRIGEDSFSTALRNLSPRSIQLEKDKFYKWEDIITFRYDGIPIGALSPSTLVYTATDYAEKLKLKPFLLMDEDGYLRPPKDKSEGIEEVGEWISVLQKKINETLYTVQDNIDCGLIGDINKLLSDWEKEIRGVLKLSDNDPIDCNKFHKAESNEIIDKIQILKTNKIYSHLMLPLIKKEDGGAGSGNKSEISLKYSRNQSGFKEVVIITERTLDENVILWDEMRPKELGPDSAMIIADFFKAAIDSKIFKKADLSTDNSVWIRPELYFLTDTLIKSKSGSFLCESEVELNINTKYLLPFRKEILQFFSPEEIKNTLKPTFTEESGMVKFRFNLPLNNGAIIPIEKAFRLKALTTTEGTILESDAPVVEIFPKYLGENWKRYFLFNGNAEKFILNPIAEPDPSQSIVTIKQKTNIQSSTEISITEISGEKSYPEAIEFSSFESKNYGIILLSKEYSNTGLRGKWIIGVDFGTSNTNVFKQRDTAESAEKWEFNFPKYVKQITNSDKDLRDTLCQNNFVPTYKLELPIPTTLKLYNTGVKENLLLDYFIYFPILNNYRIPETVYSDIKWDKQERKTEQFINCLFFLLMVEVACEKVKEVTLACSYPKAFSQESEKTFKAEWDYVLKKFVGSGIENSTENQSTSARNIKPVINVYQSQADDGRKLNLSIPPFYESEGKASGEYFASEKTIPVFEERAKKQIAAICIDVGGATTDYSLWFENKIAYDASVLLAGKQISQLLQKNLKVRELLFTKDASLSLEEKKNEPALFSSRLNLILRDEEFSIKEMLIKNSNRDEIKWLRRMMAIEFGALSFYAAMLCAAADKKLDGQILKRIENDGINLHWGGNAAKFIKWIDLGVYDRNGIAAKVLKASFYNCLNDKSFGDRAIKPKSLEQWQSPGYKSEVSGGLVVNDNLFSKSQSSDDNDLEEEIGMPDSNENSLDKSLIGVVCGETIITKEKTIECTDLITNIDLFDGSKTKFVSTNLDKLLRFVEIINFIGINTGLFSHDTKINLSDKDLRLIKDSVLAEFIQNQDLNENQRIIEPIFIMELRALLEIIKSR